MQYNCIFKTNYWDCKHNQHNISDYTCIGRKLCRRRRRCSFCHRQSRRRFCAIQIMDSKLLDNEILYIILYIATRFLNYSYGMDGGVCVSLAGQAASLLTEQKNANLVWLGVMTKPDEWVYHDILLIWSTTNENTIIINYYIISFLLVWIK
jgi:hypothetical protein